MSLEVVMAPVSCCQDLWSHPSAQKLVALGRISQELNERMACGKRWNRWKKWCNLLVWYVENATPFFHIFSLVGKCCSMRGLTVGFSTGRLLSVQKQRVQTTNQIHQMTSSAQTRRPGGVFSRSESLNLGQLGIIQCPKLDPIHSYSMI